MDNIKQMLIQFLADRNNENTTGKVKGNLNNESLTFEPSKGDSSVDADMIKGIQDQIAFLAQRDELKKVGMTSPYPLEWDSVPYPSKF